MWERNQVFFALGLSLQDCWNPTPASCLCLFVFLFFKGLLWGLGAASPPSPGNIWNRSAGWPGLILPRLRHRKGSELHSSPLSSPSKLNHFGTSPPSWYLLHCYKGSASFHRICICIYTYFIIKRPPRRTLMLTWLLLKGFIIQLLVDCSNRPRPVWVSEINSQHFYLLHLCWVNE